MQSVAQRLDCLIDSLFDHNCFFTARLSLLLFSVRADVHEKLCDLVSILARSWHFDWACPVEVEMTEGVGKQLQVCATQRRLIACNVEVSWENTSLSCRSRSQEKVELLAVSCMAFNESFVDYAS